MQVYTHTHTHTHTKGQGRGTESKKMRVREWERERKSEKDRDRETERESERESEKEIKRGEVPEQSMSRSIESILSLFLSLSGPSLFVCARTLSWYSFQQQLGIKCLAFIHLSRLQTCMQSSSKHSSFSIPLSLSLFNLSLSTLYFTDSFFLGSGGSDKKRRQSYESHQRARRPEDRSRLL